RTKKASCGTRARSAGRFLASFSAAATSLLSPTSTSPASRARSGTVQVHSRKGRRFFSACVIARLLNGDRDVCNRGMLHQDSGTVQRKKGKKCKVTPDRRSLSFGFRSWLSRG